MDVSQPMKRKGLAALGAALAAACTPSLGTFNRLAPKDREGVRLAEGVSFGPLARHKLDVYGPQGARDRAPIMVYLYGGGWHSGERAEYAFVGRAFAARGFTTIIPDYRLVHEAVFPGFIEDCARAVRWAQDEAHAFGGDASRIVLCGHSAGAYNAIMLALDGAYLNAAGADIARIKGCAGLSGPYSFYPFDIDATRNAFGQAPDPARTQPINFARADAPPIWLGWGERDDLVGRRSIVHFERALRAVGAPVETKLYPNLGHADTLLALSQPLRGRAPVLDDVTAFLARAASA